MKFSPKIKSPLSRFIVRDKSMEPNFYEGDHVLTLNWVKPRLGDVIIFKKNEVFYLKRISGFDKNSILVSGDSNTSANMGKVKKDEIIGKVIWKY